MESDSDTEFDYFSQQRRQKTKNSLAYTLCWQNISVCNRQKVSEGIFHKTQYKDVQLLRNVNGFVSPGSLVAIMGPSGSGKTTLLAAISYRLNGGVSGNIFLNGDITSRQQMLAISGFVPQEDLTVKFLTVYEQMNFMAKLKMDKRIPDIERMRKILSLMDQLGLSECSSTYLGDLSGGQRKRLSIAVQMLTDPYLLFCDEATTGLDSSNAANVVNILRKFSSKGKIVICSIHQPASGVFELFDEVLLLAYGGRVSYFGPTNEAVKYFERLQMKCPPSYNIAEFLIKKISVSVASDHERIKFLCDVYASSKQAAIIREKIQAVNFDKYLSSEGMTFLVHNKEEVISSNRKEPYLDFKEIKRVNTIIQTYYLIWRAITELKKDYLHNLTHFIVYMYVAVMVSSIYAKILHSSENRVQNIRGFINILVLETLYEYGYFVFNTFPAERPLLLREIGGSLYTAEAYYISKLITKTFYSIVAPLAFVGAVIHISDAFDHLTYMEVAVPFSVIAVMSTAYGCMLSAIFDNLEILFPVAAGYETVSYLVAGITLKIASLPDYISWLRYFSTFYYSIQTVTVLEWRSIDIEVLKHSNISVEDSMAFHSLKMVEEYGYEVFDYSYNLYILLALTCVFHFIAYLFIAQKSKRQAAY